MRPMSADRQGKTITYACAHWRSFPPLGAGSGTAEQVRSEGRLDESDYQRFKVWEKVCGQVSMAPDHCLSCPFVRTLEFRAHLPVLVSLDGTLVTPTLDMTTLESSPRHRKFLESIAPPGGRSKR